MRIHAWTLSAAALLAALPLTPTRPTRKDHSDAVRSAPVLTLEGARTVLGAAQALARERGVGAAISVVDAGGHLFAFERLEGTFVAGAEVSFGKARTAALFKKPTSVFEQIVNEGRFTMVTIDGFTPLQGGIPLVVDGQVVGAIGVSGASSAKEDEELALAGAAALAPAGHPSR
jgi:glc operon protein GlcG